MDGRKTGRGLIAGVFLSESIKNQFDPCGNAQLVENSVQIVPY
jgi:hypothetical protein